MKAFTQLLDAHTTYYLPQGYGSIYYASPFTLKSRLVGGVQKFYAGDNGFPYSLWATVCPSPCPFTESMYGWEITSINDLPVGDFIKNFSRLLGTYYDDGVRANSLFSSFGQTSLYSRDMPDANFSVTFVNPSDSSSSTITIPFGFGANTAGWTRGTMLSRNSNILRRSSAEMYAEADLREALSNRVSELRKRSSDASARNDLVRASNALEELTSIIQRAASESAARLDFLRRRGREVYTTDEGSIPSVISPRERIEEVMRLSSALWPERSSIEAQNADFEAYLAKEAASPRNTAARKSTSAAVEKPLIAGDVNEWVLRSSISASQYETLSYYGHYRDTTVVRLRRFAHATTGTVDTTFSEALNAAIAGRTTYNKGDNLIIDVTNNGGGLVCLNYQSLSFLVKAWANRANRLYGDDIVFSEYDMRLSALASLQYNAGTYDSSSAYINATNGARMGSSHISRPVTRTINSKTSKYSRVFNWNPCSLTYSLTPPAYNFDKIIVITDGRCGSSCAYFISQLRENNKVRVVSYGGIYGEPLATSSFAGGNVYNWNDDVLYWNPALPSNPFTGYIAYNLRQNYSPGKYPGTPRQMARLEADWYLPQWDSFFLYTNVVNASARISLYESVLPLFDEMPSGLARTAAAPPAPNAPPVVITPSGEPFSPVVTPDTPTSTPSTFPSSSPPSPTGAAPAVQMSSFIALIAAMLLAFTL